MPPRDGGGVRALSACFDIAVLGAGPAGMAAAATAAGCGASTLVLDENPRPGGQVYRQASSGVPARSADARAGDALRRALASSGAELWPAARVWGLGGGPLSAGGAAPFRIDALRGGHAATVHADALIVCAGTHETVVPFAGWTLPGVFGLAAATILLKAEDMLPGRRVVVAGTGPLLLAVAAGILRHGGHVVAVVDAAPRADWLARRRDLASRPALLARGLGWLARVALAGVPLLSGHRILAAIGDGAVTAVDVAPVAGGAPRRLNCDALCVGHGLTPASEVTRLFGAAHRFDHTRGGVVPVLDAGQRTTQRRLYAAGDCAGIAGAAAAPWSGRLAALAALADLGRVPAAAAAARTAEARAALGRVGRFAAAMAAQMAPPPALFDAIPGDCVVCRCEDVTRAEIAAAARAGARDLNQLKQFTRCGMGPCQGRLCAAAAAALLYPGDPARAGSFTARVPLRPVPLDALLGDFDYADIPIPAPAPI